MPRISKEQPAVCDFCSSPDVRWAFRCEDITATVLGFTADFSRMIEIPWHSDGGWAACPACKALILKDDRERLARRSAKRLARSTPGMPLSVALKVVTHLHKLFFNNRVGDPLRTTPTECDLT